MHRKAIYKKINEKIWDQKDGGQKMKKCFTFIICLSIIISLCCPCLAESDVSPQIIIDASKNEGVYSPYVMGDMFEWASDYMNGSWGQKLNNRNFEMETLDFLSSPLYDHFSGNTLDTSKWTPYSYGGSLDGTISVSNSILTIIGATNERYGVISNRIVEKAADVTIKVDLNGYSGTNAMISLNANVGGQFDNNIEFGVDNGKLKVFGDGIESYTGESVSCPIELKIVVGHLQSNGRTIKFYANNSLVYEINGFNKISNGFVVFLYGWSNSVSNWDSVSIYKNEIYDTFDATESIGTFSECLLEGNNSGTVNFVNGTAVISGTNNSRFGIMSEPVKNSSTNWTGIEVKLNGYTGINALMNIYGGTMNSFSDFIEFGVENNQLVVYTPSGFGNWRGQAVQFPCTLRVELSPYYANGRNIRFFYNGQIVYALWECKELSKNDFRVFLYSYGNSTSKWDQINIYEEHFTDIAGPNFEGGNLPNDWEISSLNNGNYGRIDSHDGVCTIYGAAGSRFGVGCMAYEFSDSKPYRVVAKLNSYSGVNGLLHITTSEPHGDFADFIEYGIENGHLTVFTPDSTWVGPQVSTPARLSVEISPYTENGRNIVFIYNGEPMYYLENTTALPDAEYRLFLYGYGNSTSSWDYADAYPVQSWQVYRDSSWGTCCQEYADDAVSGKYVTHISSQTSDNGVLGIEQDGIGLVAGHQYQFSVWMRGANNAQSAVVYLKDNNSVCAQSTINITSNEMNKYTVTLIPNHNSKSAKLILGLLGTGDLWIDQISLMPLDSEEVSCGGWRTDFIDALVNLNPGALRWPGGILSDWYDWEDGVGIDRDQREPLYFAQWNASWMSNDVGIDEFLQLCDTLNIDPVINVNYGTSTAAHAAEFVEYVNGDVLSEKGALRAINGHTNPYNIKFWEIGNETWGAWVPNPCSANDFSNGYSEYYQAMKAVDPSIYCIGEGGDGNSYDQNWNQTVLQQNSSIMDEISIHYYSPQQLPLHYSDYDVYLASVAAPVSVGERLKNTQEIISATGQDIKIAVTEYNAMYFFSMRHRTRSMEAAIQVAGLLNEFFEYPGLTDHNDYSCLTQFWDGSAIRLGNEGTLLTPSYYVLKMYSNYIGEMKVGSESISPTFNNVAIGNIPAMQNTPYIDELVTRSLDGQKMFITIINRNNVLGYNIPISINHAMIGNQGIQRTVSAENYLDANSWEYPDNIVLEESTIQTGNTFSCYVPKMSVSVIELNVSGLSELSSPVLCGKVVDSSGNAIAGARVTCSNGLQTVSDSNGYYELFVDEGNYWVEAEKTGYQTKRMNNIYVYAGAGTMAQPIVM